MIRQTRVIKKDQYDNEAFQALRRIGISIECFDSYQADRRFFHTHDYIEMLFILEGQCHHELENYRFIQKAGTLSIINLYQTHSLQTDKASKLVNLYLDINKFPLPLLDEKLRNILPLFISLNTNFRHKLNRITQIKFSSPDIIESLLELMHKELAATRESQINVLKKYFELLLIECCRQILASQKSIYAISEKNSNHFQQLEKARNFIDRNFSKQITLPQMAKISKYQPNYFCKLFKEHTGLQLSQYILHRRIEQAMILLRSTDEKILSIAYNCGFNDLSHFNHSFKKITNVTPSNYRKKTDRLR